MAKAILRSVETKFNKWQQARYEKCLVCVVNENSKCTYIGCKSHIDINLKVAKKKNKCPMECWDKEI